MTRIALPLIPDTALPSSRKSGPARPSLEESPAGKRPDWLRVRLSLNDQFFDVRDLVHKVGGRHVARVVILATAALNVVAALARARGPPPSSRQDGLHAVAHQVRLPL